VQKLADVLKQNPQRNVAIEGFTDSTGSEDYNQELSERRADAVRDTLMNMGIDAARITTRGYGKNFPVASNGNEAGRQLNRRVEVIISDESGNITSR
jgi:outer membrane protein OmpA-like peptidoglycan-associated protein